MQISLGWISYLSRLEASFGIRTYSCYSLNMNYQILIIVLILSLFSVKQCASAELVVNAVGDVMLAGRWGGELKKQGFRIPFALVADELKKGDITVANLEMPLAASGNEFIGKKFRFRGDPAIAPALKLSGINLVTLANNHIMDFGAEALEETLRHLEKADIAWIGAGENLSEARKMALYAIKGKKIAFLGYSLTQPTEFFAGKTRSGTTPGVEKIFAEDIKSARRQADYVIVSFHWGKEGTHQTDEHQRAIAHKVIDAGADVIIGHHPHVLRGIERYKRGIIFYSLGNFVFASKGKAADSTVIVRLHLDENKREAELLPVDILHRRVRFQPLLLTNGKGAHIIEHLNKLSRPFNTNIETVEGSYRIPF